MDTWVALVAAATAAFVSTNVDGFALLLGMYSDPRYRGREILSGQFASVAVQIALAAGIVQSGWLVEAPVLGLAGIIPLFAGLRGITRFRVEEAADAASASMTFSRRRGGISRTLEVLTVTTSGALDNVLAYASVLVGRSPTDVLTEVASLGILTGTLCAGAFLITRSGALINGVRDLAARIAPFATTAVGLSLLMRFNTLTWITSLA